MKLFNLKKSEGIKPNQAKSSENGEEKKSSDARVKILGGGCAKCNALESSVRSAMERLGMNDAIEHVTDFSQIAAYGVMSTPALVIDGNAVSSGRVLNADEAEKLLQKYMENSK